jgi:hypothetical protein
VSSPIAGIHSPINSSIPSLRSKGNYRSTPFPDFICAGRSFTLNKKLHMRKRHQPANSHGPMFAALALSLLPSHIQAQDEKLDMATIQKIRQEGLQDSHVMDIAFHLTDASGDRLTASPGFMRAANYAKQQLTSNGG